MAAEGQPEVLETRPGVQFYGVIDKVSVTIIEVTFYMEEVDDRISLVMSKDQGSSSIDLAFQELLERGAFEEIATRP